MDQSLRNMTWGELMADISPARIDLRELTDMLKERGFGAEYVMSGGGNGTVVISGYAEEFYIGPSDYHDGIGYSNEISWGFGDESKRGEFRTIGELLALVIQEFQEPAAGRGDFGNCGLCNAIINEGAFLEPFGNICSICIDEMEGKK